MVTEIPSTGAESEESRNQVAEDGPSLFVGKAWFWSLAPVLILADLWSKAAVFAHLASTYPGMVEARRSLSVWEGPLSFSLICWRNTGTIWGIGQEYNLLLTILRCFAVLLLGLFMWRTPRRKRMQQIVLAMIVAGAVGNLYDNFTEPEGGVRDFLLFYIDLEKGPLQWPAFNVADALICVGAILLVVLVWQSDRQTARESQQKSS